MFRYALVIGSLLLAGPRSGLHAQTPDLEGLHEQAMKAAAAKVAPCVVQIETSGGSDIIGTGPGSQQIRKGTGPTTGLIVSPDGYLISSAFNFANKPSAIFVAIPGQKERLVAKTVATDQTRMLTLLKVEAKGLPVPVAVPKKELKVGQWSLALGRTWAGPDAPPSISVGIISALGRIWGKAIQTDAKVSPVNYGGPLIDIDGRVMGVLVPASPRGQDETAGVEWYDAGIGFAIPLEDIYTVLPRLKQGKDLKKGLLGITLQSADIYGTKPVIASISPDSAAFRAGIKVGDTVVELNGTRVVRQAQILHLLGDKYEGDTVSVKVLRNQKELSFPNLKLSGTLTAYIHPFLGVLPLRDDPEAGEEVRYVFPLSPAETAGIKAGDRILRWSMAGTPPQSFTGRDGLTTVLNHVPPGTELNLDIKRKDGKKTETVKVPLGVLTEAVPDQLPQPATRKKAKAAPAAAPAGPMPPPKPEKKEPAPEEAKKPPTGLQKQMTPTRDHEYWLYVPADYDPNISYALVVWLHPAGKTKDKETERVIAAWEDYCGENHIILLCPRAESEAGWIASETEFVQQTIQTVMGQYTIDAQRVIAHGMGNGGQMAYYLGFNLRSLIRGVAVTGAVLTNPPKDNVADQRLAFFIVAGGRDPAVQGIAESRAKLLEHKFPVVYHEIPEMATQYMDAVTLQEMVRWVDSLDRQ